MAPPSDDNIKNVGSVHLTTLVVASNPRPFGTGTSIALNLHFLLKAPISDGEALEKTILARLYNHTKLSFDAPRVCFVSIGVCLSHHSILFYTYLIFSNSSLALGRERSTQ